VSLRGIHGSGEDLPFDVDRQASMCLVGDISRSARDAVGEHRDASVGTKVRVAGPLTVFGAPSPR
jgi:hypothetical protein